MTATSTFRSTLASLIETRGAVAEKQLLGRWRAELASFLHACNDGLLKGHQRLEIGLAHELALHLTVKQNSLPPALGLLRILDTSPSLPPLFTTVARAVLAHGLTFDMTLRLSAGHCIREIHFRDPRHVISRLLKVQKLLPPLPSHLYADAYSLDETGNIRAYFSSRQNPRVEARLAEFLQWSAAELKMDPAPFAPVLWQQLRVQNSHAARGWAEDGFALELHQVSVEAATRIISHCQPPCFRYLVPYRPYASIVLVGTPQTGMQAWRFTC